MNKDSVDVSLQAYFGKDSRFDYSDPLQMVVMFHVLMNTCIVVIILAAYAELIPNLPEDVNLTLGLMMSRPGFFVVIAMLLQMVGVSPMIVDMMAIKLLDRSLIEKVLICALLRFLTTLLTTLMVNLNKQAISELLLTNTRNPFFNFWNKSGVLNGSLINYLLVRVSFIPSFIKNLIIPLGPNLKIEYFLACLISAFGYASFEVIVFKSFTLVDTLEGMTPVWLGLFILGLFSVLSLNSQQIIRNLFSTNVGTLSETKHLLSSKI